MKIFALIPKNFNLSQKLNTLMLVIFLAGIVVSSIVYYNILFGNARNDLSTRASAFISTMDAVRKYNQDNVTPLLETTSEGNFLLESIPSYAVGETFNILTTSYINQYGEYQYKDAMVNPTSIKDQATTEELKIIDRLSKKDELAIAGNNIEQGFLKINGDKMFYTARPIKLSQGSCMECHTSLERSPRSLQILYEQGKYQGNQGFGWELNKVIGTKIIYLPADKVYEAANRSFILVLGVFTAIFAVAILLADLWLKQYVIRPLNRITKVAEAVSLGDMEANFEKQSNDEVGRLTDAFARMKTSLAIALRRLAKKNGDRSA